MANRADVRTLVRNELNDNGSAKVWADALLDGFTLEAIRDYGREIGLESSTTITSVANQQNYSLPATCVQVVRVEHPTGYFRKPSEFSAGDERPQTADVVGLRPGELVYEVWGGVLYLSPAPAASSESIVVRYVASYTEPANDATTLNVPDLELPALVYFAAMRACEWIATDEGKRQRFERERGSSPKEQVAVYRAMYDAILRQKRATRVNTRRLVSR
jgi:hypothetical protein